MKLTPQAALQQAIAHHHAGNLRGAEPIYRAILAVLPRHADANHKLGILLAQLGQLDSGISHLKAALDAEPSQGKYWLSYIDALYQTGETEAARQALEQGRQGGLHGDAVEALAARIERVAPWEERPSQQEIQSLMALFKAERYSDAIVMAKQITARAPTHAAAWNVLGASYQMMGLSKEALVPMQRAIIISPDSATAHSNLGNIYFALGRLEEAERSSRQAIQVAPAFAEAHTNLGNALYQLGRLDEAGASYRKALELTPSSVSALNNLATLQIELGEYSAALSNIQHSLQIRETAQAKALFVSCIKNIHFAEDNASLRSALVRALTEPWGRPADLARICTELIRLNRKIAPLIARIVEVWPRRLSSLDLFGASGPLVLADDHLLCALLISGLVVGPEMEGLLTAARRSALEHAAQARASGGRFELPLTFCSALAQQ
jgi:tetratricopeptide (TPR) repeat protein